MIIPELDNAVVIVAPDSPPVAPAKPDPAVEYATAYGPTPLLAPLDLGRYAGFFGRQRHEVYLAMLRTPAIGSSIRALKAAALSGGIKLAPAVSPDEDADGEVDPDADLAAQIAAECKRAQDHLEFSTPAVPFLWEAMDAMAECHKLAEVVLEPDPHDPRGFYRIARVKHKPRWSYRFVCDRAMNVVAIRAWTVEGEWRDFDPGKFVWLSWDARDGDPRGHSVLDDAHHAWTMLVQLWPYALEGWETFGTPTMYGTVGPDAEMVPVLDATGKPTGATLTPQKAMSQAMTHIKGNAKVAGAFGSVIKVVESARDSLTITGGIALLEAQMIRAILLQVRATVEAKFGSRADSETGENILQTLVQIVREWACAPWRRVLRAMVAANYGDAAADRLTPHVSLGIVSPKDLLAFAQAIGLLFQSGYFADSQLATLDGLMGFPPRRAGAERVGPQKDGAAIPAATAAELRSFGDRIIAAAAEVRAAHEGKGVAA